MLRKLQDVKGLRWWILVPTVVLLKVFSLDSQRVEYFYSTGFYPVIARLFRFLFGWLPFSIGDLLYLAAAFWLIYKLIKWTKKAIARKLTRAGTKRSALNFLAFLLCLYLVFNLAWGLNYNRLGLAKQLNLEFTRYTPEELRSLTTELAGRVNQSKEAWLKSDQPYPNAKELFRRSGRLYAQAKSPYPFLSINILSVKPTLFSLMGKYAGFTGYYNPFTGEAQVNTGVPDFIQPFTTTHEIAHQVGYAKENEASFAAYLVIASTNDDLFRYSCYLDMYIYANRELFFYDSLASRSIAQSLHPAVRADLQEWKNFLKKYRNPVEPFIRWSYGHFLKFNDQPQGILTYDEVIGNLINFRKKYRKI